MLLQPSEKGIENQITSRRHSEQKMQRGGNYCFRFISKFLSSSFESRKKAKKSHKFRICM